MNVTRTLRDTLNALAEDVRLNIACCLSAVDDGLCVCEIVDAVDAPQPNISRHLKLMKAAGLVEERREGKWIYYRLVRDHPLASIVTQCLQTACCSPDLNRTMARLEQRLDLREGGRCVVGIATPTPIAERR